MKRFYRSLQSKLIYLIILITLPGVIGIIYQSVSDRQTAINSALQQAITTIKITTDNQTKLIEETKYFLQNLASFRFAQHPDSPDCSSALAEIMTLNTRYINLGIPKVDGQLLCNAQPLNKAVNVSDRAYIQQAIASKDFSIGEYQVDRVSGTTTVNFAYPVIDINTGEVIAITVAVVSLDWWSKHLAESQLPDNSVAYITDSEENIIASYPKNKRLLGTKLSKLESSFSDFPFTIKQLMSSDSDARMFASHPLFDDSELIKISVGIPMSEKLQAINARLIKIIMWLFIVISFMFLIAMWGIRKSVLRPIQMLLAAAEDLELGKKTNNIPLQGSIELINLQDRFNSMAKTRLTAEQELKSSETSLLESEGKLQHHIENTPLGYISWDKDFNCTQWNHSAEIIFGYSEQEAIEGKVSHLFITPENKNEMRSSSSIHHNGKYTYKNITKDGRIIICEWYNTIMTDETGATIGMTSLVQDVTERKLIEERLNLVANVFTYAKEGIIITNAEGIIVDVNDAFVVITGYQRADILGQKSSILTSGRQSAFFYSRLWRSLHENGYWHGEIWNKRKNNEIYPELLTISAVSDASGKVTNYVGLFTDISDIKLHQNQLEQMAHYDSLTGLPNRALLADRLDQAIIQNQRSKKILAVAFLDVDGFKEVNDQHGHDIGDQMLVSLSHRIKEALRVCDTLSRFGGDEFVAILADLDHQEGCKPVLTRMLKAASQPIIIQDISLRVSVSIGVTLYPVDEVDGDQLIRHADQAMYIAKQKGKNNYHLFDSESEEMVKSRLEAIQGIIVAHENREFVLHYQPKVNMKTGKIIGVEALIRWQHPEEGLLAPGKFLPLIENHPFSIELGEWVIDESLKQISEWKKDGLDFSVSVNIGALQLQQQNFVERLALLLNQHLDVPAQTLQLEVLETSALGDVMDVSDIMNTCLELGVSFAIDDFGTGYSSLTYLRRLPASLIKVDQTFVRDMLIDPEDHAIVLGVIALAVSFKRKVIAEGVETIEHGTELLKIGCELAQGYGIARPMSADKIVEWADNWQPDEAWKNIS